MDYSIVSFDEVYEYIGMPMSFWEKTKGMDDESKKREVRDALSWPEGFLEQLKGLTLDEQMEYYGITENESFSKTSYGEIDNEKNYENTFKLSEYQGLNALIVEDGIVIGACINTVLRSGPWGAPVFPYQSVCTYIACDNDGSGTNDREDYALLFCIKK